MAVANSKQIDIVQALCFQITLLFLLLCWQKMFRGMNFTSGLTIEVNVDDKSVPSEEQAIARTQQKRTKS